MKRLKLPDFFRKRGVMIFLMAFTAVSIIVSGSYAWFSVVQQFTNEFVYAPVAVTPQLIKILTGTPPSQRPFTFVLAPITPDAPMPVPDTATVTADAAGNTASFAAIPYESPGVYQYTIRERNDGVPGYTYDSSEYTMTVTVTRQADGSLVAAAAYSLRGAPVRPLPTFRNSYTPEENARLIVRKVVAGTGADRNKEFDFTAVIGSQTYHFKLKGGESRAFGPFPVGTRYTVTEDSASVRGYTVATDKTQGTILSGGVTAVVTNTRDRKPIVPPEDDRFEFDNEYVGDLTVRKQVAGEGADAEKQFRFTVTIDGDQEVVYLRGGESRTFYDIPLGTPYSVEEDRYEGYTTVSTGASGTLSERQTVAAFTNTYSGASEKTTLTVTKTVEGAGADPSKRFAFLASIGGLYYRITLADGEQYVFSDIPIGTEYAVTEQGYAHEGYATAASGSSGTVARGGSTAAFVNRRGEPSHNGLGSLTVTKTITGWFVDATKQFRFTVTIGDSTRELHLRHGESYTFADIPPGTSYSVTEADYSSEGYVTSSLGATGTIAAMEQTAEFRNEYTGDAVPPPDPDAVQISGTKTWVHVANTAYPQSITVYAMNGNTVAAEKTVTAADNWSYAFNLPKHDDAGNEIAYTVDEAAVPNYMKTVSGYNITNTYDLELNPTTGDGWALWIWFLVLACASAGLRLAVFYRKKRKGTGEHAANRE